jgi:hypothetical protein
MASLKVALTGLNSDTQVALAAGVLLVTVGAAQPGAVSNHNGKANTKIHKNLVIMAADLFIIFPSPLSETAVSTSPPYSVYNHLKKHPYPVRTWVLNIYRATPTRFYISSATRLFVSGEPVALRDWMAPA